MTKTHAIELETVTLFAFAALAGVAFAMYFHNGPKVRTVFNLPVVAPLSSPTPTATPTPAVSTFSQTSPDGKKKVIMTVTTGSKTSKTYSFTVGDETNQQTLYVTNLPNTESMSIPFNTFSPDNNYVFLQHDTSTGSEAFVFKANGEPLSPDAVFYNVTNLFNAKQTGNAYQTTTGWASETLLIINSKTPSGTTQSYWFEVPSKAIIPLATQF